MLDFSMTDLKNKAVKTMLRFPLPCIACFILFFINYEAFLDPSGFQPIAFIRALEVNVFWNFYLLISLLGLVSFQLHKERKNLDNKIYYVLCATSLGILYFYLNQLTLDALAMNSILMIIGLFRLITIIPYITTYTEQEYNKYLAFQFSIIKSSRFAYFTNIILIISFVVIYACLYLLFSVPINFKLCNAVLNLSLCVIFPMMYMYGIPREFETEINNNDIYLYKSFFASNLYIFIPASLIILAILIAYIIKSIFVLHALNDTIRLFIIITGMFGFSVYSVGIKIKEPASKLFFFFQKYFFKVYLGLLFIMGYETIKHIIEYKIDLYDYISILILIYFISMSVYLSLGIRKFISIKFNILFCMLCILSSFGPWGMYNVVIQHGF